VGFYRTVLFPRMLRIAMGSRRLAPFRQRIGAQATGRVLDVGIGAGENLAYYSAADEIFGIEPSPELLAMARGFARRVALPVTLLRADAEQLPFAPESFDTVVLTMTLCSIPDASKALQEVRRVLRRDGRLLYFEHGLAPSHRVAAWQRRLTPTWKRFSGGCHLDRPMPLLIEAAGFRLETGSSTYLPGPRFLTYFYDGVARPLA
jgi:ubiquinone/menaquinone biosynthesis C-methylase UbiE